MTLIRNVDKIIDHSDSSLSLTFNTDLRKDPCQASYGIADVALYFQ